MKDKILIILILLNTVLFSQTLDMQLENSYVSVGEWTTFTVTASGDIKEIGKSDVPDLVLTQIGKSSAYTFIGKEKTRTYNLTYKVKSLKAGTIELPLFYLIDSKGNRIESKKFVLYVEELKDDLITNHNVSQEFETPYVKLFIEMPERNLYVGEAIPVNITAYFSTEYHPGFTRDPYIKTGSFILDTANGFDNNLPSKIINGKEWYNVQWHSYLTPLKSGELELQITLDSYIEIPDTNGGLFTNIAKKELQTSTKLTTLSIKTLPLENRPDSFTGAIGDFSMNSSLSSTEAKVGDPLTLTMNIYGSGNFQRITVPQISSNEKDWKLYPDSSSYNGTNKSNYKGVKTFQQILSPKSDEISELPLFSFSYFDPINGTYTTLNTASFPLTVEKGEFINKEQSLSTDETSFKEYKEEIRHKESRKISLHISPFSYHLPIISIVLFLIVIIIKVTLLLVTGFKEKNNSDLSRLQKEIIREINKNEASNNLVDALNAYKKLIQLTVSRNKGIKSEAVTSRDIDNKAIFSLMEKIEELNYSGSKPDQDTYLILTKDVLKELECSKE